MRYIVKTALLCRFLQNVGSPPTCFLQIGGLPLYTFLIMLYIVLTTYTADMYVILYALLILGALCEIQILHRNKQTNK